MKTIISLTVALRSGFRISQLAVIRIVGVILFVFVPVVAGLNSVELERTLTFLFGR